jgi:glucose dehydrogenase/cytochrome c5
MTLPLRRLLWLAPSLAFAVCAAAVVPAAQQGTASSGVYTAVQARAGAALYTEHCALCHGPELAGVEQAPALAGSAFRAKWSGTTLAPLFDRVVSMPPTKPNSLSGQQYAAILAYLLSANELPAGNAALTPDRTALAKIVFSPARSGAPGQSQASQPAATPRPVPPTAAAPAANAGGPSTEWKTYGGDLASMRYSPLDQINKDNFSKLQIAWRLNTNFLGPRPDNLYSATPLVIGGVLYTTAGTRRAVVALRAATGEMLWMHTEDEGARGPNSPRNGAGRGLAYWSGPDGADPRIIYVTPGYRMIALDARTGIPVATFGKNGVVDLKLENDQEVDLVTGELGLNATPLVAGDVVVVGAAHRAGVAPKTMRNARGYVRGFDARTGRRLWIFHTIPSRGEFGYDTWEDGGAEKNGNTGAWAQMSADLALNLVYVPVESPTGDYYGGNRPGNTLFSESLVALDLKTGKRRWHYQTSHHDLWDYDLPCAPILFDATIGGRRIKALAQPTKQAFLFVLNRETGEPIWPIEERAVPQSTVPDEKTSPTQPFPTRPAPFDLQGLGPDDLIDFTPGLRAEALEVVKRYRIGPLYTPPVMSKADGPLGTLQVPSDHGGVNWPGGSFDPETNRLYVHSHTYFYTSGIVAANPAQSDMGYVSGEARGSGAAADGRSGAEGRGGAAAGGRGGVNVQGLPIVKPPYDRITAYDMTTGELIWQKPHSSTPDDIRNHPALKGLTLPRTGVPGRTFVGTLTTRTLLIAGDGGVHTNAAGQRVALLRAYDKATGADVGTVDMPAKQTGSPMTYMINGKQYIVLTVTGLDGGELIAYALP